MRKTSRNLAGPVAVALFGVLAWSHAGAAAADERVQTVAAAPQAGATAAPDGVWESTRASARRTALWLARGVDSWFGDRPFEDGGRITNGRLSVGLLKRQDESADFGLRFNANFRLPNLGDQTYLFVGRDNQRDIVTDKPGAFSRQDRLRTASEDDRSFFAGLGLLLHENIDFRLGFRGGLKPYAQARYRQPWELGPADLVEFRQTLFWTLDDRLGSTTALSYERALTPMLAARWLNALTISQQSRRFEWASSLGAYQSFGGQRLLSLEALASGKQGSGVGISDYGLLLKWEQPVHLDWVLGQLVVGHFWPRKDAASDRGRAWALGGSVTVRF